MDTRLAGTPPLDRLGRKLGELRISVTDRCNFRCAYCMPRERFAMHDYLPREEILTFEEIERVAGAFVALGVRKLRLTGGEPLLRRDLPLLVQRLAGLGVELALTTNGVRLPELAAPLRAAGLHRITVSLDTLDEGAFQKLADAPAYGPSAVLAGIAAAERAGFAAIKINCVVRRDTSQYQVEPLARHFRHSGHVLRFIEFMDVGSTNGWDREQVVSSAEILETLRRVAPIEPLPPARSGETARRFRFRDGSLELGLVASITQPFCGDCTRARLSADGSVYTCLFSERGQDVKGLLRRGASDEELQRLLVGVWSERADRYSELRQSRAFEASPAWMDEPSRRRLPLASRVEMSFIGG